MLRSRAAGAASRLRRPAPLGLALAWTLLACADAGESRPNLLLITVDTLRADRLACYGGLPDVGTAMCSLAEGGIRFEWALATAPYTAPSIASILTSRYPAQHGVTQHAVSFLDERIASVAEALRDAGYRTAAFVSNPVLHPNRNLNQGFERYDAEFTRRERNRPQLRERTAEATTDAVLQWAREEAREPWFAWIHFQDPHGPYEPPDSAPGREDPGAEPMRVLKDHSGLGGIPAYQALPGLFTAGAYERRYLEEVRYLDTQVGRLIEELDSLGEAPAVLLTADHGEAFGEDGYHFAHGHSVGLDQVRVPLLWRPRPPRTTRVEPAPVSLLDVGPTLLQTAQVAPPESFRGRPLPAGLPARDPGEADRPIFLEQSYQAGVVVGTAYYSRGRYPGAEPRRDPVSGGMTPRLPARTARLAGTSPPAYAPAGDAGSELELEPLLADFLAMAEKREPSRRQEVSEESRERLRALGYLE